MRDYVDFCVTASAPNVDVLFRLFFGSLQRHSDLSRTKFHILDRGCNESGLAQIRESLQRYPYTIYDQLGKIDTNVGSSDVAVTCDWMVNNCGTAKWCVISHFDVVFKKDFLGKMREHMRDDTAMVGQHCAIMAVNREAYTNSLVRFQSISGFVAQPIYDMVDGLRILSNQYRMRYASDERVRPGDGSVPIRGFDTAQLLELEFRSQSWKVEPLTVWFEEGDRHEWYDHHGGGGSVWDEPQLSAHRQRALKLIEEGGY